jgi:flagellar hook-associated protein 1 FlgK
VWSDNGDTLSPQTGEIGGILKVRDEYIPGQLNALNQMAATLIDQVNTLHSSGYTQDGSDGGNFFSGTDATNISVLDTLTAKDLAISSSKTEVGNSDIAAKIYNLRSQKLMNGNSQSIGDYYNDKVTNLALITETAKTNKSQDSTVLDALDEQRQSVTGVSLDEEAANLTTTQKAYQAAARLMNTYDEMLDIVINQMGLVGRS